MIVYFNSNFLKKEDVKISPDDRGFNFGDGVYEVVFVYNGKLFKLNEHLERLKNSLNEMQINYSEVDNLKEIFYKLIELNNLKESNSLIYLQITRGDSKREHKFPPSNIKPTIYASISKFNEIDKNEYLKGYFAISTEDIRWSRCNIKSLNLIPNILANELANKKGVKETIFVRDGFITEGSHTNVFVVINDVLYTHPKGRYILSGITREFVIELAQKVNIKVEEKAISYDEFLNATEVFITGSSTHITPIVKVDDVIIGNAEVGKITKKLIDIYLEQIDKIR